MEKPKGAKPLPGSLGHIISGLLIYEKTRIRPEDAPRQRGTITQNLCERRAGYARELIGFLNRRWYAAYGEKAVSRLRLTDLTMRDVEKYNHWLVGKGLSQSQVRKRMQFVKKVVDRAGRPEFGSQVLTWNWESRDTHVGKAPKRVSIPTLKQLKAVLKKCNAREPLQSYGQPSGAVLAKRIWLRSSSAILIRRTTTSGGEKRGSSATATLPRWYGMRCRNTSKKRLASRMSFSL